MQQVLACHILLLLIDHFLAAKCSSTGLPRICPLSEWPNKLPCYHILLRLVGLVRKEG